MEPKQELEDVLTRLKAITRAKVDPHAEFQRRDQLGEGRMLIVSSKTCGDIITEGEASLFQSFQQESRDLESLWSIGNHFLKKKYRIPNRSREPIHQQELSFWKGHGFYGSEVWDVGTITTHTLPKYRHIVVEAGGEESGQITRVSVRPDDWNTDSTCFWNWEGWCHNGETIHPWLWLRSDFRKLWFEHLQALLPINSMERPIKGNGPDEVRRRMETLMEILGNFPGRGREYEAASKLAGRLLTELENRRARG